MKLAWVLASASVAALPASAGHAQTSCQGSRSESHLQLSSRAPAATPFYYQTEGTWIGADAEEGFVVIELGGEGPIQFPLDSGYRLQAEKRTRLSGVKDPGLGDLQRGDRVSVRFRSFDGGVVRLKLLRAPTS